MKDVVLSTQGYRGTRDLYPEELRKRTWIYDRLKRVLAQFGYEEYEGPLLEEFDLYASKSSEEIVSKQLYHFKDMGERHVAIRPEMTPTLARMVAARIKTLERPIRWFSIPTCMRYERPQRGRLREFDQLNVDLFGGTALDENIEIIQTGIALLESLGAAPTDFEVKLNHRGLMNEILSTHFGLQGAAQAPFLRELDRRDKMSVEEFQAVCARHGLDEKAFAALQGFLDGGIEAARTLAPAGSPHFAQLVEVIEVLGSLGHTSVRFDNSILRGFDYYTGLVFEVYDTSPENRRALFGGGRYENLLAAFGVEPVAGIGYGVGDVGLLNFCEVHGLFPPLSKPVDVCVARFSESDRVDACVLAARLRALGLNVESEISAARFGKQIQNAVRKQAKAVAFRGEDELKNQTFVVKFLGSGEQRPFPYDTSGFAACADALARL